MIAMAMWTAWDWTEISEGILVSVLFVLMPVLWRVEKHMRHVHRSNAALHSRLDRLEGEKAR